MRKSISMEVPSTIRFFLNGEEKVIQVEPSETVLNMLHNRFSLFGAKRGCEEGDCGACTVVVGRWDDDRFIYSAIASCIYPAAKLEGTHLITVEGVGEPEDLNVIQRQLIENNGIQCGYCTPGMVMSLFALFAGNPTPTGEEISLAMEGNICRCTGYEGIEKAAHAVRDDVHTEKSSIVPEAFRSVEEELKSHRNSGKVFKSRETSYPVTTAYHVPAGLEELGTILSNGDRRRENGFTFLAGGTDVVVGVNHGKMVPGAIVDLSFIDELREIEVDTETIRLGALNTVQTVQEHEEIHSRIPIFREIGQTVASRQIRNVATIAGNVANASPIGDFNVLMLGLGARVITWSPQGEREIPIEDFFVGYRKTAIDIHEIIRAMEVPIPEGDFVSFIKSSKRKAVDIATVNSACRIKREGPSITECSIAIGGAAPVPLLLRRTAEKILSYSVDDLDIDAIAESAVREISPIDDIRGSAEFRRALVKNQLRKHFLRFFGKEKG